MAFYPTDIQFHHRSQWLPGHEAFLSGLIDGCRKQGMVVLARTDPHATYQMLTTLIRNGLLWMQKERSVPTPTIPIFGSPARWGPTT